MDFDFSQFGINYCNPLINTYPLYKFYIKKDDENNKSELIHFSFDVSTQRYFKESKNYTVEYLVDISELKDEMIAYKNKGATHYYIAYFNTLKNKWVELDSLPLNREIVDDDILLLLNKTNYKFYNDCYFDKDLFIENIRNRENKMDLFLNNKDFHELSLNELFEDFKNEFIFNNINLRIAYDKSHDQKLYLFDEKNSLIDFSLKGIVPNFKLNDTIVILEFVFILKQYDILEPYICIDEKRQEYITLEQYIKTKEKEDNSFNIYEKENKLLDNIKIYYGYHHRFSKIFEKDI